MKISDANKFLIVSLCDKFSAEVGNVLAHNFGMMFCDVNDLVEYELIDKDRLEEVSSASYLKAREKKVIKHFVSFENVVGSMGFDYFANNKNDIKSTWTIFVKLPKNHVDELSKIAYDDRNAKLQENANMTISVKKVDANFVCEKIIENLRKEL